MQTINDKPVNKYRVLWEYIEKSQKPELLLTFEEIKKVLGFKIDHAFLNAKQELRDFGYEVERISLKEQTVKFKKLD